MRIKKTVVSARRLAIIDNLIGEELNSRMARIVPQLPFTKTQYSNNATEIRRWSYNFSDNLSTDIQVKSDVNFKEVEQCEGLLSDLITTSASNLFQRKLFCKSVYANYADIQTHHTQHVDFGYDFSAIYYPVTSWKAEDGGETVFIDSNDEVAFSVLPKPGRVIFFESELPHIARCPSPKSGKDRYSIAYKFENIGELNDDSQTEVVQSYSESEDESFEDSLQRENA